MYAHIYMYMYINIMKCTEKKRDSKLWHLDQYAINLENIEHLNTNNTNIRKTYNFLKLRIC